MRRMMIAPMLLLMGSTAAPPAPVQFPLGSWCGEDPVASAGPTMLLPGYGGGGFRIRTKSAQAQAFFDNGMQLAHAFAHKAAIAAFQEARRLDPECAMCAWGEAWASGPTINYGIEPDAAKKLAAIVATAKQLAANGSPQERNFIRALELRYPESGKGGDRAFADAMDILARASPQDDEIATIAADALMIASDYKPASLARPVELLETVLKRSPDYTPAIHFYIHATEGAGFPERAEKYADKLPLLAPSASHLVHMPSHTFYWIGRYGDAATANVHAVEIGQQNAVRLKLAGPDGVWTLPYHGHNVHFGMGGALMAGDTASGLSLARPAIAAAAHAGKMPDFRQFVVGMAYVTVARFANPQEGLAVADPGDANPVAQAMWHYARGEAFAKANDIAGVRREARAMPRRTAKGGDVQMAAVAAKLYAVSRHVLEGRAAMLRGKPGEAAKAFEKAAAIEEAEPLAGFSDPPLWWYPPRRDVAAALLAAGDAKGALTAADASLKHRPRDPVALAIRAQAEAKLGQADAAARDRELARAGWRGDSAALG